MPQLAIEVIMIPLTKYASPLLYIALLCFSLPSLAAEEDSLLPWSEPEAVERFKRAYKTDFFALANHFESQNNKIYCGVASSVILTGGSN